jgi:hypothetical protein
MNTQSLVGRKARFSHTHLMQTVNFTARVVRDEGDGTAWVEMPARVRKLPFPPLGGKRFARYPVASLQLV